MRWLAMTVLVGASVGLRVSCDCGGGPEGPVCLAANGCVVDTRDGGDGGSGDADAGQDGGRLPDGGTTAADGGPSCLDTGCPVSDSCCASDLSCHPSGCLACCPTVQ